MDNLNNPGPQNNPELPSRDDFVNAALRLWGEPTEKHGDEWRFGKKGSKSIRLDSRTWYDHQGDFHASGQPGGGGAIELCALAGVTASAAPIAAARRAIFEPVENFVMWNSSLLKPLARCL